jgi:hypothetical protein
VLRFIAAARKGLGLDVVLVPVPSQVSGLVASGFGWKVQGFALVGLEVLGHGGVSEMVAQRSGADKAEVEAELNFSKASPAPSK